MPKSLFVMAGGSGVARHTVRHPIAALVPRPPACYRRYGVQGAVTLEFKPEAKTAGGEWARSGTCRHSSAVRLDCIKTATTDSTTNVHQPKLAEAVRHGGWKRGASLDSNHHHNSITASITSTAPTMADDAAMAPLASLSLTHVYYVRSFPSSCGLPRRR